MSQTFTLRKISGTIGIERIFPVNLPALQKIEINKKGKVKKSKIYYFKKLRGKKAKIKESWLLFYIKSQISDFFYLNLK